MSINFIKSIIDAQEVKSSTTPFIGFEFNKKFTYFTFVKKILEKYKKEKKKLILINFDVLFYKYISKLNLNLTFDDNENSNKNIYLINILKHSIDKEEIKNILSRDNNNISIFIVGLDLLNSENIHNFFSASRNLLNKYLSTTFIFSLDSSSNNLNQRNERKKDIIKSKLNFYIVEKTHKIHNNK